MLHVAAARTLAWVGERKRHGCQWWELTPGYGNSAIQSGAAANRVRRDRAVQV
jgi:hypothetical protein